MGQGATGARLVGKKGFTHSLKGSAIKLYYAVGLLLFLVNSFIVVFLFLEYKNYRELVVDLLDQQSKYESYLIFMKDQVQGQNGCLDEDKKFLLVDRSDSNLKNLVLVEQEYKANKRNTRKHVQEINSNAVFSWPLAQDSFWISSFFGPRRMGKSVRMHAGIDLAALKGTSVMAAAGGRVIRACYEFGYGNTIVIEHNRKYKTRYAHLDEILVDQGQIVSRGQKIGAVGDTGFVQAEGNNASHLHFEVYAFSKQVNPIRYLPRR